MDEIKKKIKTNSFLVNALFYGFEDNFWEDNVHSPTPLALLPTIKLLR